MDVLHSWPSWESSDFHTYAGDKYLHGVDNDEILYLEAANNYVIVHTRQKKYLVYQTLKWMEKQLPAPGFLQTHKSFIVARPHIGQINRDSISVAEVRIPLSRRFRQRFLLEVLGKK